MILQAKPTWDEINDWMTEGNKQQKEYLDKHFARYYVRLRMKQTIRIIERILNEKS